MIGAPEAKSINNYKHIKQKLLKINAAMWYNEKVTQKQSVNTNMCNNWN
jgi:hypothetical protein